MGVKVYYMQISTSLPQKIYSGRGISLDGGPVSKTAMLAILAFTGAANASQGEEKALERLSMTTDMLLAIGEEMVGEPVSGMLVTGDTILVDVNLSSQYSYSFIIWTDSAFNYVDFWLTNPGGATPRGDVSDHTTLAIIPDSTETGMWRLGMELLEGAYSDTAFYAAAIFRNQRVPQQSYQGQNSVP